MEYLLEGPTEHETAVAARCLERISGLENRLRELHARISESALAQASSDDIRAELEMAQSELEFWRSKHARLGAGRAARHEGREGYWLVPHRASERALKLAHGYTDLVDVACSPRDMKSTFEEIALAVRIAIEEDGIPILQSPDLERASETFDVDTRLEECKAIQHRLSDAESELVKTTARYLELRVKLDRIVSGEVSAADVAKSEAAMDAVSGFSPTIADTLGDSIEAWRKLFARTS